MNLYRLHETASIILYIITIQHILINLNLCNILLDKLNLLEQNSYNQLVYNYNLSMNEILTLEQISEIDTFSLEQKIQQLQHHPHAQFYAQIVAIAKLELRQRYKVEQFGRMLINDEIPIYPSIPAITLDTGIKSQKNIISKKQTIKSQRKIGFAQCLKKSLITDDDALFIGRAAMGNYKYVPKQKSCNTTGRQRKNSEMQSKKVEAKKKQFLPRIPKPNATVQISKKSQIKTQAKMISIPSTISISRQSSKSESNLQKSTFLHINQNIKGSNTNHNQQPQKIIKASPIVIIKSEISPQKQKQFTQKKVQPPKLFIKYIENDVYDGEKLVLDAPQKLVDLQVDTEVSEEQIKEADEITDNKQLITPLNGSNISMLKYHKQQTNNNQAQVHRYDEQKQQIEQQIIIQNKSKTLSYNQIKMKQDRNFEQQLSHKLKQALNQHQSQLLKHQNSRQYIPEQILNTSIVFASNDNSRQLNQTKICQPNNNKNNDNKNVSSPDMKLINKEKKAKSVAHSTASFQRNTHQIQQETNPNQKNRPDSIGLNMKPSPELIKQPNSQNNRHMQKIDKIATKTGTNFHKPKQQIVPFYTPAQTPRDRLSDMPAQPSEPLFPAPYPIFQSMPLPISTFPYHEHIPSFSKLFPHSANLSIDIRSIQKQLSDHLSKNINRLSLTDEYLRIRENQLLFKVVSQSEKAIKYSYMFSIDLSAFMSRSRIMTDRIKKNKEETKEEDILLYRVVRQKEDVYDIINNAFHRTEDWYELPHGMDLKLSWNLLWTWSKPQIDIKQLFYFQKINHFFGNKEIARKDLLKKNIQRIKKLGPKARTAFDIIPETYFLPGQNMQFVRKFRQQQHKAGLNYWIMKPVGLSRGRGIELVTKLQDIVFTEPVVLQKYLENPFLLEGYKFDMRIYVLVTSMNPLQAYVYKEGFARISTQKYSLDTENVHNKFIHLTNFSVQKQNLDHSTEQSSNQPIKPRQISAMTSLQIALGGCKLTLKCLKKKLKQQNIIWQSTIQPQIQSIVLKSLISCMNTIPQNPNCFQLFGYDIIIDSNLKCWLIQVNSSPSLQKDYTIDQIVKQQLIDDIIQIVQPMQYDRSRLLEVITRRRKQLQGLKSSINTGNNSKEQLNADLSYILHGRPLRKYGETVTNNNFKRVAPGEMYQSIIKTVQQYKLTSIAKQQT